LKIKSNIYRSVVFTLIVSIGVIPALSTSSVAEEREIPESLKHLFACDETISLDKIVHENNQVEQSKNILISGKVNFEEGKAVNLGIAKGYPAILWVYQINPFPTDYRMVMSDGVHILEDDSFAFTIPENKLKEGKFAAYIFYGIPKESMQNSMLTAKAEFYIGMSSDEFERQEYEIMKKYLGIDDIKRLQLERIKESNSINSQSFCSN
jgi:hypothetical protein